MSVAFVFMVVLCLKSVNCEKFEKSENARENALNPVPFRRFSKQLYAKYLQKSKVPLESDFLLNDDFTDTDVRAKRYDDYGHLRFGKRGGEGAFDDYGHMRFGRSSP